MKFVSYAQSLEELEFLLAQNFISEILLEPKGLSRSGHLDLSAVNEFSKKCLKAGRLPIIACDALLLERNFGSLKDLLEIEFSSEIPIRVSDFGVLNYLLNTSWKSPIHLFLENHSHNSSALRQFQKIKQVKRLVLSSQISNHDLEKVLGGINVEIEVLGFGRVPVFYSGRKLLSYTNIKNSAFLTSRVNAFRFLIIENDSGTSGFSNDIYSSLNFFKSLPHDIFVRADLRFHDFEHFKNLVANISNDLNRNSSIFPEIRAFKSSEEKKKHRDFLLNEKPDILRVIGSEKEIYVAYEAYDNRELPDDFTAFKPDHILPEDISIKFLWNIRNEKVYSIKKGSIYLGKWNPGFCVGTRLICKQAY